jgi:ribosomal protein S18 acetylase RimI-like enzyme
MITQPIEVRFEPDQDFLTPIRTGLRSANIQQIGPYGSTPFAAQVRDVAGNLLGGAYGVLVLGWLHVEWLWVNENYRGSGLGGALLRRMEEIAIERGARHARLETASFQGALAFYERRGYVAYAELPLFATLSAPTDGEHRYYFLRKELSRADAGRRRSQSGVA